jgi:subtilisin family serine protease
VQADDPCIATDAATAAAEGQAVVQSWRVPPGQEEAAIELLRGQPGILFVERDVVIHAAQEVAGAGTIPPSPAAVGLDLATETAYAVNDPLYPTEQWAPQRAGFPRAWQLIPNPTSLANIRVAVIDSGVDFNHPDLAMRLLPGVNYVTPGTPPQDDNGHGTHVAGIIAAVTNNGIGIAGSAPKVLIDPRKVLDDDGNGQGLNLRYAICDAARAGARVINMSLQIGPSAMPPGSPLYIQIKGAVDFAEARGVLMVAAAGNSRINPQVYYPALFDEVMAVASSDIRNARAGYSAIGTKVEIMAPGGETGAPVLSTWPLAAAVVAKCIPPIGPLVQSGSAAYCGEIGTSMASPHVAGAAALVWSINPDLTASRIRALLKETATNLGLPANQQGAGLLNVEAAVRRLLPSRLVATPDGAGQTVPPGSAPYTTTIVLSNPSLDPLALTGVSIGGTEWLTLTNTGSPTITGSIRYGQPLVLSVVVSPTNLPDGTYSAKIQLNATRTDGTGIAKTLVLYVAVGVSRPPLYLPLVILDAPLQQPSLGPPFTWETGISPTVHTLGAAASITVPLPFDFPLAGPPGSAALNYSTARVYADGFLTFPGSSLATLSNPGTNRCLPMVELEQLQGVFGWWGDLDPSVAGAEVSSFRPADGPARFVVQYKDVALAGETTRRVSFQIVLYATGDVQLNYLQTPGTWAATLTDYRPFVTVGLQVRNGLFRNQVVCQTASTLQGSLPQSRQSLRFSPGDLY